VKRCLYKILKNARVTNEELYTLLTEIEATLNSRPLTYVPTEDLDEPSTPSHLINGRRINSLPDAVKPGEESRIEEITHNKVARRVSYLRTLKEHFWLRWKNEYLLELHNAHRQKTKRQKGNCIKVGDVAVIHEENVHRVKWRLGRIAKLIEGKDGAIRGAVVRKLADKGGKCRKIRRLIQKLYPVELSEGDEEIVTVGDNTVNASEIDDQKTELRRRPIREAARKAQAKRQELIESGSL
jgi:hypothetical protein